MRLPRQIARAFLTTRAWAIVRARHLRRHPHCAWCRAKGPKGMTVDHVIPRSLRPDLQSDPGNLQTLCSQCHGQAKQHHERVEGDTLRGGSTPAGWPLDPAHPWNLPATAPAQARLTAARGKR